MKGSGLMAQRSWRLTADGSWLMAAVIAAMLIAPTIARAQGMGMPAPPEINPVSKKPAILDRVGIDQKIGQQLPLDVVFNDETGRDVRLGGYFGTRPVVIALAYYECPMLCTQVINGMTGALKTLSFDAGKDFEVVVISINPVERPTLAAEKKATTLKQYARPETAAGWHFLTGSEPSIKAVANAIGFRYAYDDQIGQYAHGAAIYVATPSGIVARYLLGVEFPPTHLRYALVEASNNQLGTIADQVLLFCYHYDPATGKYGVAILRAVRIGGVLTVAAFLTFLFVSLRRERQPARTTDDRRLDAEIANHI
jgi:protein SCO1